MEAASTSAGMTHRRKLCVPVLLAIDFTKMESPVNLQVSFESVFKRFGRKFPRSCLGFRYMDLIEMQYPVENQPCFPA